MIGRPQTRFPDLVILRAEHPDLLKRRHIITRQMPLVVVEVISPDKANRDRDLIDKRSQYAELGIPEYWLIDPEPQSVTILELAESQYRQRQVATGDDLLVAPILTSVLGASLPITTRQIFHPGA